MSWTHMMISLLWLQVCLLFLIWLRGGGVVNELRKIEAHIRKE